MCIAISTSEKIIFGILLSPVDMHASSLYLAAQFQAVMMYALTDDK